MINWEKQRQTLKQISFVVIALAAILAFPRLTAQEAKERRGAAINHAYALPQRFALEWKEHVPEGIENPGFNGFGSRVIRAAVSSELCGETDLTYEADGLRCRFSFEANPV